jgi:UDP-glucose 4-epimerase
VSLPFTHVSCLSYAGTAVRDYIHVDDVARGHLDALNFISKGGKGEGAFDVFNFGTGEGTTVLELIAAVEEVTGKKVPVVLGPRREGDLPESYCDPSKAYKVLGWKAQRNLKQICEDAWRFQVKNPQGYLATGEAATASR